MQDDYRIYLFESFVKVVDNIKPKAFIFENVTGMLSAKPGGKPVVERIYKAVSEIGYTILEPQKFKDAVYNAFDYSVPQNRERVILCGVKNGSGLSITDFYDALSNNKSNKHLTVREAIGGLPPIFGSHEKPCGLCVDFCQSEQEKLSIYDATQQSPELFHFCIKGFSRCICRPIDKVVKDFILSVIHSCRYIIEGFIPKFSYFAIP